MSTISSLDAAEHSPISPSAEYYDDEPDEEWKLNRMQIIEDSFKDMIQEAKDRLERKLQSLRQEDLEEEEREREREFLVEEYQSETAAMKVLAKDEFEHALARERLLRRLRRDLPARPTMNHQSPTINHIALEQQQAATLKAATNDANVEAAFQSLIHPSSNDHPSLPPDSDATLEMKEEVDAWKEEVDAWKEVGHISPGAGALTIKITRLPPEPPTNGTKEWVKASDAARKHDLAVRQAKTEAARITGPPPPPPIKWVSASDAARRTTQRRIGSS